MAAYMHIDKSLKSSSLMLDLSSSKVSSVTDSYEGLHKNETRSLRLTGKSKDGMEMRGRYRSKRLTK